MSCRLYLALALILTLLFASPAAAEIFTKQGRYTLDKTDWTAETGATEDTFHCASCDGRVMISIAYGAEIPADHPFTDNEQFIKHIASPLVRQELIRSILHPDPQITYDVNMDDTEIVELGGLQALMYTARARVGDASLGVEKTRVLVHQGRMALVTLLYDQLGEADKDALHKADTLLASLKFESE